MTAATSVLVVDDSALMRKYLKQILLDAGFDVHTARDGLDALDQVERVQPDVVTLDINMPEMDGLSCLTEIMRRAPRPVVMVSSLTERGAVVTLEALELGAVDYVAKPGGTVSLNLNDVSAELVTKVRMAADVRIRRTAGLSARLRAEHRPTMAVARTGGKARGVTPAGRVDGGDNGSTRVAKPEAVLVGSSTGGPPLLTALIGALPPTLRAPVVVAQHMPPSFTAALAQRLDQTCEVQVCHVTRAMSMRPGHVYIGQGNADVLIARSSTGLVVKSVPAGQGYRWHPSVDRLVASARNGAAADRLVGVLLTGMGDDGAAEMAALRAEGGRTIAESEETAVDWGMPGELVNRGGATCVLPGHLIARRIVDWAG